MRNDIKTKCLLIEGQKNNISKPNRSQMGIIWDVLEVVIQYGHNGAIISSICRKANLSHYVGLEKCEDLIFAGLIEPIQSERNRPFRITEKGLYFFEEFSRFKEMVESMNLRC